MSSISKIPFVDLYVHVNGTSPSKMRPRKSDKELPPLVTVPSKYDKTIDELKRKINNATVRDPSLEHDGVRYRVSSCPTSSDAVWASLRKISPQVPTLPSLGIPQSIQKRLKFFARNTGLIIVCGATGQGKSTTSTAVLSHYLEHYGDVCITIEDPVEYDLQSHPWSSHAACYQFEVHEEHEWADYLKMALRWHPKYIYLGELRTPEATAQALRAATSGHLVLTTLHAGSIEEAIHALRQLAAPIANDRADALISDSFLSVVHQELTTAGPKMKILYTEGKGLGDPVRSLLRNAKVEQLSTYIERQNR